MIKLLQCERDWTASPDTDGVATAFFNAWQSPEAKKADVPAPDTTKPRASSLQNTLLRRPHSTSAISAHLRESATWPCDFEATR
jgi:hypothetical protein